MDVEFDPAKDVENQRKHGVSLARAEEFKLGSALTKIDDRRSYGETRYRSLGPLDDVLYLLVFTLRGDRLRAISLRPANRKERKRYAEGT